MVLDAVARVKAAAPDGVYCCDPVMGDVGRGMFVRPGIPELMRDRVVPAADIVTPNHFELDFLAGTTSTTLPELLEAADARAGGRPVRRTRDQRDPRRHPGRRAGPGRGLGGRRLADPRPRGWRSARPAPAT